MQERRILTVEEKHTVRQNFSNLCYLCDGSLEDYEDNEIEYDHIYAYADQYTQELSNFAPVHASRIPTKKNCHAQKGRKSPYEFREELRIQKQMLGITGLKDICKAPQDVNFEADYDSRTIRFGEVVLPLYSQLIDGRPWWYFFHDVPIIHIANDEKIQLRPLEAKIYGLIHNLRHHLQLLPSLGRLSQEEKVVKIFDGQHKAVAQMVGNQRQSIACIVFLNPDVDDLRVTVFDAHTTFLQQRYKRSHIAEKLAVIYRERIEAYRESVGNPDAPFTEKDILRHDGMAAIRQFVMSQIIQESRDKTDFIDTYVATSRAEQRGLTAKPVIWQNLELLVKTYCNLEAVDTQPEDPLNYREEELDNFASILQLIAKHMLFGKWNPPLSDSEQHRLARNYFYDKAFTVWIPRLEEAMRNAVAQMRGRAVKGALCYRDVFDDRIRHRFDQLIERLAIHGVWLNPGVQPVISGNSEADIRQLFDNLGLDWVYLTRIEE
jgi:hypothetical protein